MKLSQKDLRIMKERGFSLLRDPHRSQEVEVGALKMHCRLMRIQLSVRGMYKNQKDVFRRKFQTPKSKTDWKARLIEYIGEKFNIPPVTVISLLQEKPMYGAIADVQTD